MTVTKKHYKLKMDFTVQEYGHSSKWSFSHTETTMNIPFVQMSSKNGFLSFTYCFKVPFLVVSIAAECNKQNHVIDPFSQFRPVHLDGWPCKEMLYMKTVGHGLLHCILC